MVHIESASESLMSGKIEKDYNEHLNSLELSFGRLLCRFNLDFLLISSGPILYHFQDDREYPFKVNPYFKQWVPITQSPDSYLLISRDCKPILFLSNPDDIWLAYPGLKDCDWDAEHIINRRMKIVEIQKPRDITQYIANNEGGYIGSSGSMNSDWNFKVINDAAVYSFINYYRCYKSAYEVTLLYQANLIAASGHKIAAKKFYEGASELEIFHSYIKAIQARQQDDPYEPMIALNENASILHYQLKNLKKPLDGVRSMMIDAGASFAGYAADVSRTYSFSDDEFADLITHFDELQQQLVTDIKIGMTQVDLHDLSYQRMAEFMRNQRISSLSVDEIYHSKLVDFFYPHSLSHFLGLQVHDVGAELANDTGLRADRNKLYLKRGQYERAIEAGMVFTVEPGIYFISSRLDELRNDPLAKGICWDRVNKFLSFGGIRIEDDIFMNEQGAVNLTRLAFN